MRHYNPQPIPQPIDIHPYFDQVQVWFRHPLNKESLERLATECGRGGINVFNSPAMFDHNLRQRLQIRQPLDAAIKFVAEREDALINRVEVALDYIFESRIAVDRAYEFLHYHKVRRWHGKSQEIKIVSGNGGNVTDIHEGETRYDAGRSAPNKTVFYRNKHSRITGELNCLHLEWHLNNRKTVTRAGILSGQDLLEFDHRAFWNDRLLLRALDREHLGRLIRNRRSGTKSRTPLIKYVGTFQYNVDSKMGTFYARKYDGIQQLLDGIGREYRIERALSPISTEGFLPGERAEPDRFELSASEGRIGVSSSYITNRGIPSFDPPPEPV